MAGVFRKFVPEWLMRSDRVKHFRYGVVLGFFSILVAVLAGLAKEVKDEYDYGGFDGYDLLATVLGGVLGRAVSLAVFRVIYMVVC